MIIETWMELDQEVWTGVGVKGKLLAFSVSSKTGRECLVEFEDHRSYWIPGANVFATEPVPVKTIPGEIDSEEPAAPASVQEE